MTGYEIYIFVLCLVVFVALTVFFAALIACIAKMNIKLIRGGFADGEIRKQREKSAKKTAVFRTFEILLSAALFVAAIAVFFFSLQVKINEKKPVERNVIKVVKSASMAEKDGFNKYLTENNLNDQIQMFDLIVVSPLPKESDLKLYDIVVYEADGQMIVHRIVDIKEADETHPQRRFVLQGDANRYSDKFPVLYSQMKGIYGGKKVPYIGSFVVFMNSPAGWLCVLLVVAVCIAYPFIEKKLKKEADLRFAAMQAQSQGEESAEFSTESAAPAETIAPAETAAASAAAGAGGRATAFIKPRVETLFEKYLNLTEEQKRFYDEIVAYAAAIPGSRQIKNDRYEEYRYGNARLVRVLIRRDTVVCAYLMTNVNFKRYVAGNKIKVKTAPSVLKISDESALRAAKDSIGIAKKIVDDEKAYKKDQAKLRRRARRNTGGAGENA